MTISDHRLRCGRLSVYIEPRDLWVGLFRDPPRAWYVVPFPTLVVKWTRQATATPSSTEPYDDLLADLVLYIGWYSVTRRLPTVRKELFADAIERSHDRRHGPDGEDPDPESAGLPSYAPRWWREDYDGPPMRRAEVPQWKLDAIRRSLGGPR